MKLILKVILILLKKINQKLKKFQILAKVSRKKKNNKMSIMIQTRKVKKKKIKKN